MAGVDRDDFGVAALDRIRQSGLAADSDPTTSDAASHEHRPDRLTDLHPHGAISMGDYPVEFGAFDSPAIDVESAGTLAEGFDGSLHSKVTDRAEVDESNARWLRG